MSNQEVKEDTQTIIQMLKDGNWETVANSTNAHIADRESLEMDLTARDYIRKDLLRNYEYFYETYHEIYLLKKEQRDIDYSEEPEWLIEEMEEQLCNLLTALEDLSKEIEWQKEALESSGLLTMKIKEEEK